MGLDETANPPLPSFVNTANVELLPPLIKSTCPSPFTSAATTNDGYT